MHRRDEDDSKQYTAQKTQLVWTQDILKRNFILHVATEGQVTEVKGVRIRRRTQFLDDLESRRRYWELKEEAVD